jgi:hypothetical protein
VDPFIKRQNEGLFASKSVPQENLRPEVPRVFLEAPIEGF